MLLVLKFSRVASKVTWMLLGMESEGHGGSEEVLTLRSSLLMAAIIARDVCYDG